VLVLTADPVQVVQFVVVVVVVVVAVVVVVVALSLRRAREFFIPA